MQGAILGVSQSVLAGLPATSSLEQGELPFSIAETQPNYQIISNYLTEFNTRGTTESKWGGLYFMGDEKSPIQIFNIDGDTLGKTHTFSVAGLAENATVIFNVSGENVSFKNVDLGTLQAFSTRVLFNFYEAKLPKVRLLSRMVQEKGLYQSLR